jgi:hypothetical protein
MKRSSGPRKTADLSKSVHQQLSMYALAAGAAGVSALACLWRPNSTKVEDGKLRVSKKFDGPPKWT